MRRRTVVVVHREPLVAEAIASALGRYAWLAPIAVGSRAEIAGTVPADAAVVDGGLDGAEDVAIELRRRGGVAIVLDTHPGVSERSIGTDRCLDDLARALAPDAGADVHGRLTTRERQVLSLVAKGLAGKQVASLLGISAKTVEQHKSNIYGKLGVANQAAAVAVAARGSEGVTWISSTT